MILSVNGIAVAVEAGHPAELAAARELLRQRAVAVGLLETAAEDEAAVDAAIEALLEREGRFPPRRSAGAITSRTGGNSRAATWSMRATYCSRSRHR